jgi:hypothetical protein
MVLLYSGTGWLYFNIVDFRVFKIIILYICLTLLLVAHVIERLTVGLLINNELERKFKKVVVI